MTTTTVVISLRHSNKPLRLQGLQQATDIARIEPEPAAQRADIGAIRADFKNEPRLRQRAAPSQVIRLERADTSGHKTIEAANALQLAAGPFSDFSQIYPDFK